MNYSELNKIKENRPAKWEQIDFGGDTIGVLQYLPTNDKYDLIMIALQKSEEGSYYNPIKLDMYFHLNIIYLYTDLVFSPEDRTDEAGIYDTILETGLLATVLDYIPKEEIDLLTSLLAECENKFEKRNNSVAGILSMFTENLAENAAAAKEIVDNFDPVQFQSIIDFTQAANGNRAIKNNASVNLD